MDARQPVAGTSERSQHLENNSLPLALLADTGADTLGSSETSLVDIPTSVPDESNDVIFLPSIAVPPDLRQGRRVDYSKFF